MVDCQIICKYHLWIEVYFKYKYVVFALITNIRLKNNGDYINVNLEMCTCISDIMYFGHLEQHLYRR